MEWSGPAIEAMPMSERMVLTNMAVEAGAKCGLIASDSETARYLGSVGREADWTPLAADPDASYGGGRGIDGSAVGPMLPRPPTGGNRAPRHGRRRGDLWRSCRSAGRAVMGRAWKFGDNVSTDQIAAGRYYHLRSNLPELAKHVLEDARTEFASGVKPGDFIVGGRDFGKGGSRGPA